MRSRASLKKWTPAPTASATRVAHLSTTLREMTDAKFRAVLAAAPSAPIRGVVTRFVFERRRMRATSPAGSAKAGGRYNPAGIEALYTSFTRAAALAEFTQDYLDADPIEVSCMLSLLVSLDHVVDLTEPVLLNELETDRAEVASVRIPRKVHVAERIGAAANAVGADGLIVWSARSPGMKNLVIFPTNAVSRPPFLVVV
jgi:RES domain-containing protein